MLGTLTLALRSVVDFENTNGDDDDGSARRSSVNMIRFGVSTTTAK
jgi:hypothetical protein